MQQENWTFNKQEVQQLAVTANLEFKKATLELLFP